MFRVFVYFFSSTMDESKEDEKVRFKKRNAELERTKYLLEGKVKAMTMGVITIKEYLKGCFENLGWGHKNLWGANKFEGKILFCPLLFFYRCRSFLNKKNLKNCCPDP